MSDTLSDLRKESMALEEDGVDDRRSPIRPSNSSRVDRGKVGSQVGKVSGSRGVPARRNQSHVRVRTPSWIGRRMAHGLVRKLGFDVIRHPGPASILAQRIERLRDHEIDLVIDVGANTGQYALELRDIGYRGRIVSVEPLPDAFAELARVAARDAAWQCRQFALGDRDGKASLIIAGNSVSSSLLPMTPVHETAAPESRPIGTVDVDVRRLDRIFPEIVGDARRPFLKVDTQGSELRVLEGGASILERLFGLQVELSLVELYERAPLMGEVIQWIEQRGFVLTDLEPEFRDPASGELLQLNGLFFRPGGGTLSLPAASAEPRRVSPDHVP